MFYLSQLINATVENPDDTRAGKLIDVLLVPPQDQHSTQPDALLIEGEEDIPWRVPVSEAEWSEHTIHLRQPLTYYTPQPETRDASEISLAHEIMDKQVIDMEHKKVIRVNDIAFDDDWHIVGVDNTNLGLVRRLAPAWLLGNRTPTLTPWQDIELLDPHRSPEEQGLMVPSPRTLRTPSGSLAELHPADIAAIVHQLTPEQGARLIERLDDETAADTMEEIDTDHQRHILDNINTERAADILEEMGPDEAADLLARVSDERADELLRHMEPEESEDVQELLEYEPDTAGGLMTTDYVVLNQTRTIAEALEAIRTNIRENDVRTAYVYCVEDETQDETRILGTLSLWDMLIADNSQPLQALMETDVITVDPDMEPRAVAERMAKYNLLAVPVVSEDGILQGIVTVDDALDVLLPNESRRRPRRMY
ncbi:MAG TPA: hypothetical protein DHW02_08885 [Ktedonobacter sp.]|nr:hypothetical protein [Ktedonobacter sp.]